MQLPVFAPSVMINFHKTVSTKDGRTGKVVEIVLFRRDETIGYGLKDEHGKVFYVGKSDIK